MEASPASQVELNCYNCNLNLAGYRYIIRDDRPFCIKCYEQLFANTCEKMSAAHWNGFEGFITFYEEYSSTLAFETKICLLNIFQD